METPGERIATELRPWADCMREALDRVFRIRQSIRRNGVHEFSEYSQADYDAAIARMNELTREAH